jgi:hypothetical protein
MNVPISPTKFISPETIPLNGRARLGDQATAFERTCGNGDIDSGP